MNHTQLTHILDWSTYPRLDYLPTAPPTCGSATLLQLRGQVVSEIALENVIVWLNAVVLALVVLKRVLFGAVMKYGLPNRMYT